MWHSTGYFTHSWQHSIIKAHRENIKRNELYWIHYCGFIIWCHKKLFRFNVTTMNKTTNLLFLKRAAWSERETGPFLEDNGQFNSLKIPISGLSFLHDVKTLTHTYKRHSGSSENFKSPVALNLDKKNPISGLLTLCWSSQSQKYYPLNTVDRLRDLQHSLGQRQDFCLILYRRSCTVHFYQNQVKRY